MAGKLKGLDPKAMLIDHGEKVVFGIAGLLVVLALVGTDWSAYDGKPSDITKKVVDARQVLQQQKWEGEERQPFILPADQQPDAIIDRLISPNISPDRFAFSTRISQTPWDEKEPLREPVMLALQQPIALGADFVIHSTTKYLNGHSDVVGGAVVAASDSDAGALADWANVTGITGAPFDAYLTLRGLRTLFPRIEQQQANAGAVADFLSRHPQVAAVHYPGLASHPGHAIAKTQQAGFGAMLSVELKGGLEEVRCFVNALEVFTLAESLGGVESLIAHPATMTHAGMGAAARKAAGITDVLLRLSIGIEAEADLLGDLEQALGAISQQR